MSIDDSAYRMSLRRRYQMLVDADPERFFVPPYQGPFGWIGVRLDVDDDDDVDWSELAELVEDSYRLAASKKLLAMLDG